MLFSYATARSLNTAKKVTEGLNTHFPLIIYNGAFVKDNITEEILIANYFEEDVYEVLKDLFAHEIYPIIYSYQNNIEKFSYIPEKATSGMQAFLNSRRGDKRTNIVTAESELMDGNLFYITCIVLISRRNWNHFIINIKINITLFIRKTSIQENNGWRSCHKKHPKRKLLCS